MSWGLVLQTARSTSSTRLLGSTNRIFQQVVRTSGPSKLQTRSKVDAVTRRVVPTRKASTAANEDDIRDALAEANTPAAKGSTTPAVPIQPEAIDALFDPETGSTGGTTTDWSRSYSGLGAQPFSKEVADILLAPIDPLDVEMKPDGLAYLPEIKYRRILLKAFGPGGWGLAPRSETNVGPKVVSREYALIAHGRLVAVARGEQEYFDPNGVATAVEACKSNALMRCCKDLGIASELWDPRFLREFKAKHCVEVFAEHVTTKKKKKLWRRKDQGKFDYPYKE